MRRSGGNAEDSVRLSRGQGRVTRPRKGTFRAGRILRRRGEIAMSTNMYLKFEGPDIDGGVTAAGHQGEIEVLSWSHGFAQPTNSGRSTSGRGTVEQANHANLSFTK